MTHPIIHLLYKKDLIASTQYEKITESTNHDVYAIENCILKIDINKEKLYKEYIILQHVYTKVQCPKPLFFEEIEYDTQTYFILGIEKLDGKPIDHFRSTLSIEQKNQIIQTIVTQIIAIHSHTPKDISLSDIDYFEFIKNKTLYAIEKARNNPNIEKSYIDSLYERFLSLYETVSCEKNRVLLHNDIWYKNILIDADGIFKGIIDFEEALLWPAYVEYYRICDHLFFAKNYIEKGSEDYTEIEFVELLIKQYQKAYTTGIISKDQPGRLLYSLSTYIKLISNFEKERYVHEETVRYHKEYIVWYME